MKNTLSIKMLFAGGLLVLGMAQAASSVSELALPSPVTFQLDQKQMGNAALQRLADSFKAGPLAIMPNRFIPSAFYGVRCAFAANGRVTAMNQVYQALGQAGYVPAQSNSQATFDNIIWTDPLGKSSDVAVDLVYKCGIDGGFAAVSLFRVVPQGGTVDSLNTYYTAMNGNLIDNTDGVGGSTFMNGVEVLTADPITTTQYGEFVAKLRNSNKKAVDVTLRLTAYNKEGQEIDVAEPTIRIPARANFTRSLYFYSFLDYGGSATDPIVSVLVKITQVGLAK
jgi:hypothetical protein